MKNLFRIPLAILLASLILVGCSKEDEKEIVKQGSTSKYETFSDSEGYPHALNQDNILGKRMFNAMEKVKFDFDFNAFYVEFDRIGSLVEAEFEALAYEPSEDEIDILLDVYRSFDDYNFEEYVEFTNQVILRANREIDSDIQRQFVIAQIERVQWVKYGEVTQGNPVPGSAESYDNYLDRCVENWINETFIWSDNYTWKVINFIAGPETLGYAAISCTETYLKS